MSRRLVTSTALISIGVLLILAACISDGGDTAQSDVTDRYDLLAGGGSGS